MLPWLFSRWLFCSFCGSFSRWLFALLWLLLLALLFWLCSSGFALLALLFWLLLFWLLLFWRLLFWLLLVFRGSCCCRSVAPVAAMALSSLAFCSRRCRSVAPVAAVALFLAGFALYEYSRTSWGWEQLAANLAPWRCFCFMRHLMTEVAAGGSE